MKFHDVKTATLTYVLSLDRAITSGMIVTNLGAKLGEDTHTGSTFDGQVKRALAQLAEQGLLDRRKRAWIGYGRRDWMYETPGLTALKRAEQDARLAAKETEETGRWTRRGSGSGSTAPPC